MNANFYCNQGQLSLHHIKIVTNLLGSILYRFSTKECLFASEQKAQLTFLKSTYFQIRIFNPL